MVKNKISKNAVDMNLYMVLFIIAGLFILLNYGGFFESMVVVGGIIAACFYFVKRLKFRVTLLQGLFFLFSLWYFFCTVKNGFVIEYTIRSLIPFVVFLFWVFISNNIYCKEKVLDVLMEVSVWVAVSATLHCIISSIIKGSLQRASFPFDYSNVCGIYFAACYYIARGSSVKFLNRCKYVFLAALLLTQSVGSIILFSLVKAYEFILEKRFKKIVFGFVAGIIFFILFRSRILESFGTFAERLLHIYDGFLCMCKNPVFGIGAGWWEIAKNSYQTGFYKADTLHSSITAVGVNSGFFGLMLFLTVVFITLIKNASNKRFFIPLLLLVVHSLIDFTLSFLSINILIILLLENPVCEKGVTLKPVFCKIVSSFMVVLFCTAMFGVVQSNIFQKSFLVQNLPEYFYNNYENNFCLRYSIKADRCYAYYLTQKKDNDVYVSFRKYKYVPDEIILYHSVQQGSEEYLLKQYEAQPYNLVLRDYLINNASENTIAEAECIFTKAVEKASFLGKFIYNLKGE